MRKIFLSVMFILMLGILLPAMAPAQPGFISNSFVSSRQAGNYVDWYAVLYFATPSAVRDTGSVQPVQLGEGNSKMSPPQENDQQQQPKSYPKESYHRAKKKSGQRSPLPNTQQEDEQPPERPHTPLPAATDGVTEWERFLAQMDNAIGWMETILTREKKKNLILVFDLDETFFQYPEQFKRSVEALPYLILLQEAAYIKLDDFLKRNPRVILIYNTARNRLPELLLNNPEQQQQESNAGVNMQALSDRHGRRMMRLMIAGKNRKYHFVNLPIPHALIASAGSDIQFGAAIQLKIAEKNIGRREEAVSEEIALPEASAINSQLQKWVESDFQHYDKFQHAFTVGSLSGRLIRKPLSSCAEALFNSPVQNQPLNHYLPGPHTPFATIRYPTGLNHCARVFVQNITVNKGSGLRVLLSKIKSINLLEPGIPMLLTFGDHFADLPMLRPDLEIESLTALTPQQQAINATRWGKIPSLMPDLHRAPALFVDRESINFWWRLSVLPNGKIAAIKRFEGQVPAQTIEHGKVGEANEPGLPGLLNRAAVIMD